MPDNPLEKATKVNLLFQVIMHAVQTYLKNVEMFIFNSYPDKLIVLIDFVINAVKICCDRKVFDKRDLVIHQMMLKCSDMKQFLMLNQRSMAKFASIPEKHKTSLTSRSSFAYENAYGSKLSMYDAPTVNKKLSASRLNQRCLPSKSPYDAMKPRNLRSSHSSATTRSKMPPSRNQSRVQSPKVKPSISNVSTAVQKVKLNEPKEFNMVTVSEKPFEDLESHEPRSNGKQKELEIMEMLQNIAKDKIQEMLVPFLAQLMPQKDFQKSFSEESENNAQASKESTPRVTSDIPSQPIVEAAQAYPEKTKNQETVDHVAKNVQYIYVKSNDENPKVLKADRSMNQLTSSKAQNSSSTTQLEAIRSQTKIVAKIVSANKKPPLPCDVETLDGKFKELKEKALKERLNYVKQMMENPLYMNEACHEPWKMFAG